MLSSHVKRSPLLWLHNKSRFCNDLAFHWFYIINRTLHGRLEIRNFSSRVKKRNFVSPHGHVIYRIRCISMSNLKGINLCEIDKRTKAM